MRRIQNSAPLAKKIGTYVNQLAKAVQRGNFIDGIPPEKVKTLGKRKKYWDMLTVSEKQTYLRMMSYIVKDKNEDYHLGDENFQNTVIGGRVRFINSIGEIFSEKYTKDPFFDWPHDLHTRIEVSKSDFNYGKLMIALRQYMNIQSDEDSRSRRYSYACPSCKQKFAQGTTSCLTCGSKLNPDGYPMILPDNKVTTHHCFKQYDQIAYGIKKVQELPPLRQQELIIASVIGNTNSGYPFFEKQRKDRIDKMWFRFLKFIKYDAKPGTIMTVNHIYDVVKFCIKKDFHFPYVLFARTQGGASGTKHRCVFGAPFIQKLIAAVIKCGKDIGYMESTSEDDPVFTKHIFAVGKLPIVAQANWDEMFTAIKKRLPEYKDGKIVPMSAERIFNQFGEVLSPGDYEVNVLGDDFPGFDTGQIAEDFEILRKHKGLGWLFGYMIDDMYISEVWSADKIFTDVHFKSGFPMTSEFGSFLHRKANYNAALANHVRILANINLSDDDIIFTIGLTPDMINDYLKGFGLKIKVDESFNYSERPIVAFLKVLCGYVFKTDTIGITGDPVSRYYGLAHQERPIEQEVGSMDFTADVKGVYQVTGDIEVDSLISKLASWGSESASVVRVICEIIRDTDLGHRAILALSTIKADADYSPYRSDVLVGFPPNWLATVDVADLIVDRTIM